MSKLPHSTNFSDDFQTPPEALDPLIDYINDDWIIWECACGKGNLVDGLESRGFSVVGTDINNSYDFLDYEPKEYDMILTNPPFSLKQRFLERAYFLNKPFAFLLPLTTFEGIDRQKLFKEYGVQVIFLPRRLNFETPSGEGSGSWFATAWFTNYLNLPSDLNFYDDKQMVLK